jgi:hypothetical protein
MKIALLFSILLATPAWAAHQHLGVIECKTDYGVPAWESPGSLMQVKQLSCGQQVAILGSTSGYLKIQISENIIGYIEAKYIKRIEGETPQTASKPAIVPAEAGKTPAAQESGRELIPSQEPDKADKPKPRTEGERSLLPSGWEIGTETSYIQYLEPSFMKEKGIMLGYFAGYNFHLKNNFMFKLETRFNMGNIGYSSPTSGTMSDIRDFALENRFLYGMDAKIEKNTYISLYLGLGHRYLRDNSEGKQTDLGQYGYLRESHYLYTPFGFSGITRVNKDWRFSVSAEYDAFWHGWQYSEVGSPNNSGLVAKNDQPKGWGTRASIEIIRAYPKYDFIIQPYVRYWDIKASDVFIGMIEPRNNSKEGGIRIGLRF